jgi:hypothetical protein
MTEESARRQRIAEKLVAGLAGDENLKAALLTGSAGRGTANASSDINLILYYGDEISKAAFDRIKRTARDEGGKLLFGKPGRGFAVLRVIAGISVELGYTYLDRTAAGINQFLISPGELPTSHQVIFNGIAEGIPLHGRAIIHQWQNKLASYPAAFQTQFVQKHVDFWPLIDEGPPKFLSPGWFAEKLIGKTRRAYLYYDRFLWAKTRLVGVLCGLNHLYHPGKIKDLDGFFASVDTAPENLAERMRPVEDAEFSEGNQVFSEIIRELLDLVEAHIPDVETAPVRARFQPPISSQGS